MVVAPVMVAPATAAAMQLMVVAPAMAVDTEEAREGKRHCLPFNLHVNNKKIYKFIFNLSS